MAYSYVPYTGTGFTTDFTFSFPYLNKEDVGVFVNRVEVPFTFINNSTVRLVTPPPMGTNVVIKRNTGKGAVPVNFTDGSTLLEKDLDLMAQWALMVAQEAEDVSQDVLGKAEAPLNDAVAAAVQANAAATQANISAASAIAVQSLLASPTGSYHVAFQQYGSGAVVRRVEERLRDRVSVLDFAGVDPTGVADSSAAIQAGVDNLLSRMPANAAFGDTGFDLYFPPGRYRISNTVRLARHGIGFVGPKGRGAYIVGTGLMFDIGDPTNALRQRLAHFENLIFVNGNVSASTIAVRLYRTAETRFLACNFIDFDIAVDCYRASTPKFLYCTWDNGRRTVNATACVRLQGTDETSTTGDAYSPGGGFHFGFCEFSGARITSGEQNYTEAGLLIHSVDGLYMTQCHMTGMAKSLFINPLATGANRVITDIQCSNCYWDEPSTSAPGSQVRNVSIEGEVKGSIPLANGGTTFSIYQMMRFNQCYFRGANAVDRCVAVRITDTAGDFFNTGRRVKDINFNGGTFRQSRYCAIQVFGRAQGDFHEPYAVKISGAYFEANASGSPTGVGSAITAACGSLSVVNNTFGWDAGVADYVVSANVSVAGNDSESPSLICANNDFSKATVNIKPINFSTQAGARVMVYGNLLNGAGQLYNELVPAKTTDAASKVIWEYLIPASVVGFCRLEVIGGSLDGSTAAVYVFEGGFRRVAGGASSLSSGTASLTSVRSWNPSLLPTIPVAGLDGNSLKVSVTGPASGEAMDWVVHPVISQNH